MTLFDGLLIAFLVILVLFIFVASRYNAFVKNMSQVDEDFSDVDIQLKRKADLIGQLVEVVKGYAKHEKETFVEATKARSGIREAVSIHELEQSNNRLNAVLGSIMAVIEDYPKIKADQAFKQLMTDMRDTEDRIAEYREVYNSSVRKYNTAVLTFPNVVVSRLLKFSQKDYFTYTHESTA